MNRVRTSFLIALMLAMWSSGQAQTTREPQTLAECLQAVQNYPRQQYEAARTAGQRPKFEEIEQKKSELARQYAARFSLESVPGQELPLLARLYAEAKQDDLARAAIGKRLSMSEITEAERAATLATAVQISMTPPLTDEKIGQAEEYAARLDALSDGAIRQKIETHYRLCSYYRGADVDEKILEHGNRVLALAQKLTPVERKSFSLAHIYVNLAEVHAGREDTGQAIAILKQGLAELADSPNASKAIDPALERYSLVGKPAGAIKAEHWLNAEPGVTQAGLRGQVTLLQFTAHWCGPCRKSYPSMLKFHQRFAHGGLQVLFATQLYGFFEKQEQLKPEEELAADRKYFVAHHGLPFKIAIAQPTPRAPAGEGAVSQESSNEQRYAVGGIPQIVVIDKQGIVRLMMVGRDPANETRLTRLIERLLAEPAAQASPFMRLR